MRISDWSSDVCSSDLIDFIRLGRRHRPDGITAVRVADQQPFLLQPRQRLAHRNLADPQFGGQRVLTDRHVGRQLADDNLLAHDIEHAFGQGSHHYTHFKYSKAGGTPDGPGRSEEHTSELQSLMRISYA